MADREQSGSGKGRGAGTRAGTRSRANDPHAAAQQELGSIIDRRLGLDRRQLDQGAAPDGSDRRGGGVGEGGASRGGSEPREETVTGLERRRGPGRRRSDFRAAAEDGEMNREQFLFLMAIDAFKKANGRSFPSWSDVLEVVRLLGYRKTAGSELNLPNAEDWRERSDAPSGVRPDGWERRFSQDERASLDAAYGVAVGGDGPDGDGPDGGELFLDAGVLGADEIGDDAFDELSCDDLGLEDLDDAA
ncbi:MAG: hypothetical protein AAF235_08320 [Planctomycetota bacterium]